MKRKPKASTLRTISVLAVAGLACLGLAAPVGLGTPSAFGVGDIAALCPLGGVEAMIASKTIVPPMLIGLAIVAALTLVLGRAFCAWGCPVPLLKRVFGGKKGKRRAKGSDSAARVEDAGAAASPIAIEAGGGAAKSSRAPRASASRYYVLGASLLTTAAFGFPVFCLVCPVGLTFGTLVVVWRLFQFSEVTWSLLVFPAILVLELVVLRKWCHRFCPLGALLSLMARGNRTLRPQADGHACLHVVGGEKCHRCADACPEGINLHDKAASAPMSECVKCRACADACPVHAIRFPLLPKTTKDRERETQ